MIQKTTSCRCCVLLFFVCAAVTLSGCSTAPKTEAEHEEEAIARTEFTDRIENFFEYAPLRAGKTSQFLIHLTDLRDGAPVEKASVTLKIFPKGSGDFKEIKAKIGRVTGIYVAEVELSAKGKYDIEFHVSNDKLNERQMLEGFEVE